MAGEKTSIWKKEISFRRKPKAPKAPERAEEKQSVWKKEIRLRPQRRRAGYLVAPEDYASSRSKKPSFWKKEISFQRKARPAAKAEQAPRRQPFPEPVLPEPAVVARPEPVGPAAQSDRELEPIAPAAEPTVAPREPTAREERATERAAEPVAEEEAPASDLDAPVGVHPEPEPPGPDPPVAGRPPVEPELALAPSPPHSEEPSDLAPPSVAPAESPAPPRGPFALPEPVQQPVADDADAEDAPAGRDEPKERLSRGQRKARRALEKEARKRHGRKAKKLVGLKIGASQLAAACVSNNGSAELLQVAREPLEAGIVVAGELRDPESLATALKAFFRKSKLPRRDIRLGLSNNRIGVRIFDIGGIEDPEQLRNAIRFRAQETLPIPIEEAVLDYHVVGESVEEDGSLKRRVLLVVAHRDLVDRYVAACRKAGLRLVGIDLEAFALLRALGTGRRDDGEERVGLVVVSVGHDRSTFAVSDGNVCEFTRVLDWGGSSLNVAIARALDLTPSEAEPIKLGLSLADRAVVPDGLTSEQLAVAREEVLRALEGFARDLVSSLRYYQSQPESLGIREVVLTGGTSQMPGLAAELQRLIGVYVRVGDPLARVRVSRRVKQRDNVGSLAAAVGLGIEV